MSEDELNKQDEIVNVRLPRKEYELLRTIIDREETYRNVTTILKTHWIWVVGGGALALYMLWEKFNVFIAGVK